MSFLKSSKKILTFDSKTDKIIQKDCDKLLGYETDEINQIAIDKTFKYLACCDDSYKFIYLKCAKLFHRGNTTIADARSYEKIAFLGKQHENVFFFSFPLLNHISSRYHSLLILFIKTESQSVKNRFANTDNCLRRHLRI